MKKTIAFIFFILVVVAELYAILMNDETVEFITKPLLMVSLATFYLVSVSKPNFWYVSALFFSFWGDTLLLFDDLYFVYGLASFLVAHVLYITIGSSYLTKISIKNILVYSIPFVGFLVFLLWLIEPNLGQLFIPVAIYGVVISVFGVVSLLTYINNKSSENLWFFLGAIIFVASDSVLAINKFLEPKEMFGITIMVTYIVAQFLLCKSLIVKSQ